jgi:hypothetical protein
VAGELVLLVPLYWMVFLVAQVAAAVLERLVDTHPELVAQVPQIKVMQVAPV